MSTYQHDWAILDDNGSNTGVGVVSVLPTSVNWGRMGRHETYFYINGSNDRCKIEVSQDCHEFLSRGVNQPYSVEIEYNETLLSACAFDSNCKYISIVLSGNDASHFELTSVYVAGATIQDTDWFNTIEPADDPGQSHVYGIEIRVRPKGQNLGKTDLTASLTVTGWSGNGNEHYTDTVNITHKCEENER